MQRREQHAKDEIEDAAVPRPGQKNAEQHLPSRPIEKTDRGAIARFAKLAAVRFRGGRRCARLALRECGGNFR